MVLAAVLVGFVAHSALHLEPSMVALLGAGALVALSRLDADQFLEEVEWPTLVFFMGLFIMVGALVEVGVIGRIAIGVTAAVGDRYLLASSALLWGSAVLSGIVDNIPYVATMTPLVAEPGRRRARHTRPRSRCGGPWPSAPTSAATPPRSAPAPTSSIIGIAARNGHPISFWHFTRYGVVVALVTIAVAWLYLWLRYFAFG